MNEECGLWTYSSCIDSTTLQKHCFRKSSPATEVIMKQKSFVCRMTPCQPRHKAGRAAFPSFLSRISLKYSIIICLNVEIRKHSRPNSLRRGIYASRMCASLLHKKTKNPHIGSAQVNEDYEYMRTSLYFQYYARPFATYQFCLRKQNLFIKTHFMHHLYLEFEK